MLYGYILIPHLLSLILGVDQSLIQILANVLLASLHLRALPDSLLHPIDHGILVNAHLFHQF